jgi:nitrilase
MSSNSKTVKAAAVQAELEWLDLAGTVKKTCKVIGEAAAKGANIAAFPEIWVPGYRLWIWYALMLNALERRSEC